MMVYVTTTELAKELREWPGEFLDMLADMAGADVSDIVAERSDTHDRIAPWLRELANALDDAARSSSAGQA